MVPGNEVIDPSRHGAFQDAVIRKVFDNGKGFWGHNDVGKGLDALDDFPGHIQLPTKFQGQHPFDFSDDEGGGGVEDVPSPGQLKDGFGVAAKIERRNNDVGVNYYS
jgi:hypothetical protein